MYNYTYKIVIKASGLRKDGTSPIYLQLFINKKRRRFSLNVYIKPKNWDAKRMLAKGRSGATQRINEIIYNSKAKTETIFYDSISSQSPLTIDIFKDKFFNEKVKTDFLAFVENEIEASTDKTKGTIKAYQQAFKHLKSFKKEVRFMDLTFDFIQKFDRHMKAKGLSVNTVAKHHKNIKHFVNTALKKGYRFKNPYMDFKFKFIDGHRDFLSQSELNLLMKLYDDQKLEYRKQLILQAFLFMATTGVRFGDMQNLCASNLVDDVLIFIPEKTKYRKLEVRKPLSDLAKKYLPKDKKGFLFVQMSNQKYNFHMKRIAELIGIKDKTVTAHVARHTFATIFLELGGAPEVLKQLLDHENIATTMVYVHITKKREKEQLKLFDKFLVDD